MSGIGVSFACYNDCLLVVWLLMFDVFCFSAGLLLDLIVDCYCVELFCCLRVFVVCFGCAVLFVVWFSVFLILTVAVSGDFGWVVIVLRIYFLMRVV